MTSVPVGDFVVAAGIEFVAGAEFEGLPTLCPLFDDPAEQPPLLSAARRQATENRFMYVRRGITTLGCSGISPYPDTPPQAHPVLSCGVDGIHWSAMTADSSSGYVVVMTVPPSFGVNLVVGESLNEFLSLGCGSHFAALGSLVEDFTAELEGGGDIEQVADVMAALRARFGLALRPNVAARLSELEARYGRPAGRVPRDREAEAEGARRSREFVE